MRLKHFMTTISFAFLLIFAATTATVAQHSVTGMPLKFAIRVVEDCVVQAASFNKKSATKIGSKSVTADFNREGIRAQDTLDFLGINDPTRISLLRRLIIGNRSYGVRSVWTVWEGTGRAHPYHIRRIALDGVDKTWTVAKLATVISDSAEIAVASGSSVAQFVAECRKALGFRVEKVEGTVSTFVDLGEQKIDEMAKCLAMPITNKDIGKLTFEDDEGDTRFYRPLIDESEIATNLTTKTYAGLVTYLQNNLEVRFSEYDSAIEIVMLAVRADRTSEQCPNTFTRREPCGGMTINESKPLDSYLVRGDERPVDIRGCAIGREIDAGIPVWKSINKLAATLRDQRNGKSESKGGCK